MLVLLLAVGGLVAASLAPTSGDGAPRKVIVPSGASLAEAADSLHRKGIIRSPRLFRVYAKVRQRDRSVKAGTYLLRPGASYAAALNALTSGQGLIHTVTIPEGYSLAQIIPILATTLGVSTEEVEAAVRDTAFLRRLDVPTPTLEGYLFPDTYTFGDGTTARTAVELMIDRFEDVWRPEWTARLQALAMSRHDVVTLASIVEKEARLAEERPVIAAVYHNRLKIGMPLQADPTVQYARGRHTSRLLYRDLEIDSRYNTYKHRGLPPGPIASPGAASLQATLFPAEVPYKFFVAHPDGHHEFRVDFRGHTEARRQIARERRRMREDSQ